MVLKTGMLVGIVGTGDMGVLIQIRASSNTCVIKLNNGTLKKNIPLEDVEEARDMSDTKEKKSPIRLGEGDNSPTKSPGKLAALSVDHRRSTDNLSTLNSLNVGDSVRARCNGGSRWFPGEILRVNRDGTFDVEYTDGDIERKMAAADVEAASKSPVGATSSRKRGFAVGDKIKARYKNGTKLFGGEISRVRSDGTYDIKYDDGDVETRVAEASIEESSRRKNESDDEIPARRKSKSDGFRVDQSVKARYKGGKKMFAGKIKRVHSDGTYDIRYDDGDEEKRVKAENIEASGDLNVDDNDLGKVKGASSRTRTLTVGKKVKARYKKGRRLFPGKISRVRSDGTYDIDYDDGEIEFRVEASQIEVSDNDDEDMFADSDDDKKHKPSAPAKKCSWEVGDRVKAFYGKGKRLLPGRIVKVHINGTYDIRYQDGDSETRVDASLIREEDSDIQQSTKTKGSPVSASNISTKRKLRVGDAVKAKYRGGAKLFPGKITRERLDGTFDIRYEDGDSEERVKAEFIQPAYGSDDEADLKTSKKKKISFEVDDIVKAPFQRGSKLFRGKISRARSDGTYDVVFDDGDRDTHVPGDLIQAEEQPGTRDTITKNRALKVGDVVKARYKKGKKVFPGKVTRVRSDGTYDIEYDDGDVEMRVDAEMIEFSESMKREDDDNDRSTSKKVLKVGDKVRARYNKGSKMLRGVITATHRDGTYDVRYDDGDKEKYVEAKNIELAEEQDEHLPSKKSPEKIKVGDLVEANYKNGVKMFAGKISRMHSDGTYDIAFNDGDVDRRVPRSRIKLQDAKADQHKSSPKAKRGFSVGDTVKAKYKNGTKFFTGKISRVRSDGTFDIEYDDGDKEAHVDAARIVAVESDSPRRDRDATKKFEVGDVVKARYKKGSKLFAGKISRVRSDGTFDIKYDDGDVETHVESTLIESEHIASSKSRDSGDEKKKLGFAEGDTVKARYKGGVKMYPGKILKARLDGTFDIQFDDGDVELRVKSNAIEAIVDSKPTKSKGEAKAGVDKDDIFGDSDSDGKGPSGSNQKPIKVGDAVDANFKQKGKFHRGKVVRVHSDSTFDIEYDVGASEKRVRSADIKRINEKQESGDDSDVEKRDTAKKQIKGSPRVQSSDSDKEVKKKKKSAKKAKTHSSSESSASDRVKLMPLKKGLFEEGVLKKKPRLVLLRSATDSSSSGSSSASSGSESEESSNSCVDKVLKRLFDSGTLQSYRRMFKKKDTKGAGKISKNKIIGIVEELMAASKPANGTGHSASLEDDQNTISHILKEWFGTHDDLRTHRNFEFKTLMLAFAYAKSRVGKLRIEQSVATVLEGRFATYHENRRQLELWQQKLGFRLFETLQRHFHQHALPNMIPSRIRASALALIFEDVSRDAMVISSDACQLVEHKCNWI
ncbi:hypothetical protein PHYBOEH_000178 [Phytophthora boehmeriae]|uniref:EF-hand domain-containing protein n=1 Tax=Phytophthora boehmeriae TaxID=109152 RepID=A0A8T1WVD8_9STRA|nr:hypothetical protein PHYBOEH_000178 [Phytophthora boehmeriae]